MTIEMLDGAEQAPAAADAAPKTTDKATALALKQMNANVAEFDAVEAGLQELEQKYTNVVYDVTTTKGMTDAKAARMEIRQVRYNVQNAVESAKRPLEALKKAIAGRGAAIIARTDPLEKPIDAQIKAEEERKAAKKAEEERKEAERVKAINDRVEYFAQVIVANVTASAADIQKALEEVEAKVITLDEYAERAGEAEQSKRSAVETLGLMLTQRKAADEANAAAARLAEEQRQREEEQRARDEAARVEREKAEAAERERIEAERKKLDDERAAFQRQQEAFRQQQQESAAQAEREAKEKADRRVRWQLSIGAMKDFSSLVRTVREVDEAIENLRAVTLTFERFGELLDEAAKVRDEEVAKLQAMRPAMLEREEAAQREREQRRAEEEARAAENRRMAAASANAVKLLEVARRVRPAFDGGTDDIHSVMTALDAIIAKIDAEAA